MSQHYYHIETFYLNKWCRIKSAGLQYLKGFLDSRRDASPRLAYRLVRNDGRIMEEVPECNDVHVGMIAGWPTAAQYEMAAAVALEKAAAIRKREQERDQRI